MTSMPHSTVIVSDSSDFSDVFNAPLEIVLEAQKAKKQKIKEKQERMSRIKKAALIGGSIAIGYLIIRNRKPIFDAMKVGVGWLLG